MRELAAVFIGGVVGALARAGVAEALPPAPGHWPWATLLVNVAGAFVLGAVAARGYRRALLGQGFCGALTTFSAFQLELLHMLDAGRAGTRAGLRRGQPRARPRRRRARAADGVSAGLWIGIGLLGGLGAVARVLLGAAVDARADTWFPWGTWPSTCRAPSRSGCSPGARSPATRARSPPPASSAPSPPSAPGWSTRGARREGGGPINLAARLALGLLAVWLGRELGASL